MQNEVASIRQAMGLSYKDFGALFGVHRTTIMRWERAGGRRAPEAMLRWMRDEFAKFQETRKRSRRKAA